MFWFISTIFALTQLRNKYKDDFEKKHLAKLGFMSFFIKGAVAGLQEFPMVNALIDGTDIVTRDYADISVAVSTPTGLVSFRSGRGRWMIASCKSL